MAQVLHTSTGEVEVFKFRGTGLVALCQEVADYTRGDVITRDDVDPTRAYYKEDADTISVVFPRNPAPAMITGPNSVRRTYGMVYRCQRLACSWSTQEYS
jgi:hypothetical protein